MERIQLDNTVFEGSNAVYLLGHETDGPTTLVDTGVAVPHIESQLRDSLGARGVAIADLDQILLTHHHQDHAGLAGDFQAASGATVRVHEADAALVARDEDALADQERGYREAFERWHMPPDRREDLMDFFASHDGAWSTSNAEVVPFEDGDVLQAGDRHLEVVHLPGHAAGQAGFYDPEADHLFAGDALLPRYTPNVGGADLRVERPLASYVDSLHHLLERSPSRVLPGHRAPIEDPADRAREILSHHRERTANVLDVLCEHGPADAWAVSAHLFGDLEDIHVLHGPGEAAAHLDHLVEAGVVELTDGVYDLAVEDLSVDAVLPGTA